MLLAHTVAVLHAAAVLVMLTGALVALWLPRVLLLHAPLSAAILGVALAGADCPLTTLEAALRERAGGPALRGGFLEHYAFGPLGVEVASPGTQACTYVVAVLPNALGYGLLAVRSGRGGLRRTAA